MLFVETPVAPAKKVVAIIDYRASRGILNVQKLLEKADREALAAPDQWRKANSDFKSLTVFTDGSCLLHRLSAASMTRRMKTGTLTKDKKW